jgi:hypothetical protein
MQDLTPDMEDLLRRAAVNYPLKEGEDRWNEIDQKLGNNKPDDQRKSKPGHQNLYDAIILITLLLSFLFLNRFAEVSQINQPGKVQSIEKFDVAAQENPGKPVSNDAVHFQTSSTSHYSADREAPALLNEKIKMVAHEPLRKSHKSLAFPSAKPTSFNFFKEQKSVVKHSSRFQLGIMTGIHLSAISKLKFERPGQSIGVFAGYQCR